MLISIASVSLVFQDEGIVQDRVFSKIWICWVGRVRPPQPDKIHADGTTFFCDFFSSMIQTIIGLKHIINTLNYPKLVSILPCCHRQCPVRLTFVAGYSTRSFKWVLSWQFFFTFFNSKYLGFFWLNTHLAFPHHGDAAAGYYQAHGHITAGPATRSSSTRLWGCTMRLVWVKSNGWLQMRPHLWRSWPVFLWCHQGSIWMFACYWLNWARHRVLCDVCNGYARWNGANRSIIDGAMKNGPSLIFC